MNLRIGSLCSGYGGLDLAVMDALGGSVAWHAQHDPDDKYQYAAQILAHRFLGVPNHGDITVIDWSAVEDVDVLTAGFPCQPISYAGLGKVTEDARWIWPAVTEAIRTLRPSLVVLENVSALVVRGLSDVLRDLAALGFDAEWRCIRASDVGAPHQRERVFVLAWPAADSGCDTRPQDDPHRAAAAWRSRSAGSVARGVGTPADTAGDGRDERRPEPARQLGRPDAAVGRSASPADPTRIAEREPADHPHPVAGSRETRPEPVDRSMPDRERERERTSP